MKKILFIYLLVCSLQNAFSQCTDVYQGYQAKSASAAIISDNADNVYMAGLYTDTIRLSPFTLSTDSMGLFLCKISSSGNVIWAKTLANANYMGNVLLNDITLKFDNNGNLVMAGTWNGAVTSFDTVQSAFTNGKLYVARFNPVNGTLLQLLTTGNNNWAFTTDMCIDASDNIYLTGGFVGVITFGSFSMNCTGTTNTFVTKLNPQLQPQWAKRVTNAYPSGNRGDDIEWDKGNYIYVCGPWGIGTDFGNGVTLSSPVANNAFLAKYDVNGNIIWARAKQNSNGYDRIFIPDSTAITVVHSNPFTFIGYNRNGDTLWSKNEETTWGNVKYNDGNYYSVTAYSDSLKFADLNHYATGYNIGLVCFSGTNRQALWVKDIHCSAWPNPSDYDVSTGNLHITGTYYGADTINQTHVLPNFTSSYYNQPIFYIEICDAAIGIEEAKSAAGYFVIYPNPAHNTFTISFNELKSESGELKVYDITGREVLSEKIRNPKSEIRNSFSPGVYLVKVTAGDRVMTEKLVVE